MNQCKASPLGGGSCELPEGHEGKHKKAMWRYDNKNRDADPQLIGYFEWDTESQIRLARKHGSRFD